MTRPAPGQRAVFFLRWVGLRQSRAVKTLLRPAALVLGADLVLLEVVTRVEGIPASTQQLLVMLGVIAAGPAATIVALELLEPRPLRHRPARWAIRLGALAIGLPLLLRLRGRVGIDAGSATGTLRSAAMLVALALVLFALFRTAAELIGASFRLLPSLRARFVVLCILSGALARMVSVTVGGAGLASQVGVFLSVAAIIWGFAATASTELVEALNEAVAALQRLGAGDLTVQLAVRGRDEVSEVARALANTTTPTPATTVILTGVRRSDVLADARAGSFAVVTTAATEPAEARVSDCSFVACSTILRNFPTLKGRTRVGASICGGALDPSSDSTGPPSPSNFMTLFFTVMKSGRDANFIVISFHEAACGPTRMFGVLRGATFPTLGAPRRVVGGHRPREGISGQRKFFR